MIKKHNETGLKYLCKTTLEGSRFDRYLGSGLIWRRHLSKHGPNISTEIIFETDDPKLFKKVALEKSIEWNIVESEEWANLVYEAGQGGMFGASEETLRKISKVHKGKPKSAEQRAKMSVASKGKSKSPEHARKCALNPVGKKRSIDAIKRTSESVSLFHRERLQLPSNEELVQQVSQTNISVVARRYKCSRGLIRKLVTSSYEKG